MNLLPEPHKHHSTHLAIVISVAAAVLTAAFHVLLFQFPYGIPFAISVALVVVAVQVITVTAERHGNPWAHLFLIPTALGVLAEVLYASETVRVLGFLIVTVSIAMFSFWLAAPRKRFFELATLWPSRFFFETLFPFDKISSVFSLAERGMGANGRKILFGIALAVPFLIIIGSLFASADPLFKKATVDVLFDTKKLPEYIGKFTRDFISFFFLLGIGSAIAMRSLKTHDATEGKTLHMDRTIFATFLIALNLLFALFIAFQFAYFFGGESVVTGTDITYAEYARQGFFQLLWVAGIVFVISGALYRAGGLSKWLTRELALVLILQTSVIIASAASRLTLYIEAFGLTVSRWWAMAVIILIATVLASIFISSVSKFAYAQWSKVVFVTVLTAVSVLNLMNVEGWVARVNIERFLSEKTTRMDIQYLINRSSDTIPALAILFSSPWPTQPTGTNWIRDREYLSKQLLRKLIKLDQEVFTDWRRTVVSDYRAYSALASLELYP